MKDIKLAFVIFNISFLSFSQIDNEKALKNADKKFDNFAYVDAREIYLEVAKSGYKSESLFKKLGDSYYFNNELSKSLEWYQALYDYQKKLEPDYLFRYAMALKSVERYEEADKVLNKYHKAIDPNYDGSKKTNLQTPKEILELNSDKSIIAKTSINSEFSDYAPAYYESKIVFASSRKNQDKVKQTKTSWNNQPFSDLYVANLKNSNELDSKVERMEDIINSPYHEASPVFTKDGKTIFFTRNNYTNNKFKQSSKGVNLVKLYRAKKGEDGKWQKPEELAFNSDEYSIAHPALSVDEKKLFFSSDMPGTLGMSDIFVVDIYEDGSFGTPSNLGDKINTPGRESYPFISNKNQLFFSSDGHGGLGGYDILVTELRNNKIYGEIVNVGVPINSPTDDFSLILDSEDNTGFFSSNRADGSGSDDIYSFSISEDFVTSCKQHIKGYITDDVYNEEQKNVKVQLLDDKLKVINSTTTNDEGLYKFDVDCNTQYTIRVADENYINSEKPMFSDSQYEKNITQNLSVKKGKNLGKTKAKFGDDIGKTLQLEPIYFDFDKDNIRPDAEVELQKVISFLKKNKDVFLDIRSHTDSFGEREYNIKLSTKRAESTIDYLAKNGISKSRLSGRGYGDTQLVNDCVHGVNCSDEEHQLNRRSEFIINNKISRIPNNYSVQDTTNDKTKSEDTNITEPNVKISNDKVKKANNQNDDDIERPKSFRITSYDFNSKNKVYTVQLVAVKDTNNIKFDIDDTMYQHTYSDGITRVFSGTFKTKNQAEAHKQSLLEKGFTDVFTIALQGETRSKE